MPKVCQCVRAGGKNREPHYHTPSGNPNPEWAGSGLKAYPFRPGKTARDKRGKR